MPVLAAIQREVEAHVGQSWEPNDDFERRRELWRIPVYLAVIAVDGANPFGRSFISRLDAALRM